MGGDVSWPPLSESTRPVLRSPSDSFVPSSPGSSSSSQAPLIPNPPQRQVNTNTNANRTRSRNRGGGGGRGNFSGIGPSYNMFNQPYSNMPPPFPVYDVSHAMFPNMTGTRPAGFSRPHMDNDSSSQRNNNTPRRGNYGPRPRGEGPNHNNNHGGRRSHGRRDVHNLHPHYVPPPIGYMPPFSTGANPYMVAPPPPQYPPFSGQMGFDMASPYIYIPPVPIESYRAMAMPPPPPPPPPVNFPPVNENHLTQMLVRQAEYYFCDDNLASDNFLRARMDPHGFVPVSLIATFPRMQQITNNVPLILDSLRYSTKLELQGEMVRRQTDWQRWILNPQIIQATPPAEDHDTETPNGEGTAEEEESESNSSA